MILIRSGFDLFLIVHDQENPNGLRRLVYKGDETSILERFYIVYTIYYNICLVIIRPGAILLNFGNVERITKCEWYTHQTKRADDPIDFFINTTRSGMNISIKFLYSDLSMIIIDRTEDGRYNVTGRRIRKDYPDLLGLPLSSLHTGGNNTSFIVQSLSLQKAYSIKVDNIYTLIVGEIHYDTSKTLTGVTVDNDYDDNDFLYLDGTCVADGELFTDILKMSQEMKNWDINLSREGLNFYNREYIQEKAKLGVILEETVEGVSNFSLSSIYDKIYIIQGDTLKYKIGNNPQWHTIMSEGAANLKFPTHSYYDCYFRKFNNTKSSRY